MGVPGFLAGFFILGIPKNKLSMHFLELLKSNYGTVSSALEKELAKKVFSMEDSYSDGKSRLPLSRDRLCPIQ